MTRASQVAKDELEKAIETLMGTDPRVWSQAVQGATEATLKDLSGSWEETLLPFVADFLLPRKATDEVLALLRSGHRTVLVDGPPLSGKSNVLRDLCIRTKADKNLITLFVEADAGRTIRQLVADVLTDELKFLIREEEAGNWARDSVTCDGTKSCALCGWCWNG